MSPLTIGSLFDGIGGFPLSAQRNGMIPLWASEVEAFPVTVTQKHFPEMKHLGDITKINGGEIPPVDIVCGGFPCQNLSISGRRAGIHGEESGLFFEMVRLVKEMRDADRKRVCAAEYVRPRLLICENVPGIFSSGNGEDHRIVLEEICRIAEPNVSIPRPTAGRWESAGAVLGC